MRPSPFALEEHALDGVDVIAVTGELDLATAPRLSKRLNEAILSGTGGVIVDLCDTAFIDSSGLHALMVAARQLARRERVLTIVCPPGRALRHFEQTGLASIFKIVASREAAMTMHRPKVAARDGR
jgi:anti-sigma B factor antagonist